MPRLIPRLIPHQLKLLTFAKTTLAVSITCFLSAGLAATDFSKFQVGALPNWMIRFPDETKPRLRINSLMSELSLSRLQAIELQNHFLDGYKNSMSDSEIQTQFDLSLARVKAGDFESQLDPLEIQGADFVVVFDLDATLYDQNMPDGSGCIDISYSRPSTSPKNIMLAPGWESAFDSIRKLNGKIVLFSANPDEETLLNLSKWKWGTEPLYNTSSRKMHPSLSGILTNHHLVRQASDEAEGASVRSRGTVLAEPSKDLRIVEESLKKVIIVDDNPSRLFQMQNARVVEKFNGRTYCELKTKKDPVSRLSVAQVEGTLAHVVAEIQAARKRTPKYDFVRSYLPYSYFGALTVRSFVETNPTLSETEVEQLIVENPTLVRTRY